MSTWTRNKDIRHRLEKRWNRGEFLTQCIGSHPFEPLRIPLKRPTAKELTHEFDAARNWIAHLAANGEPQNKNSFTIEWKEADHRTLGKNKLPSAVIFQTLDQILAYLGRTREAKRFQTIFQEITTPFPELADLLMERPLEALAHETVWTELLSIASYIRQNPRPDIYLRQLEIPGVDTKFIETHKSWLTRLLNLVLPKDAVDEEARGASAFESRFGFRSKPSRIRFRTLDPSLNIMGLSDLEIPEADFWNLPVEPDTIFIVENDINGLAFPPFPGAIVIFGLGYGLSALSNALWMHGKPVCYWGDMDTHGFAMLNQIRHHFPQTRSFLMDHATLLSHRALWGKETSPVNRDLDLLTIDEASVYDALRNNVYTPRLRLEQERISFTHVRSVVSRQ